MASFSAYTRYDNRKQFQYNKRNNDVVNNTNQRSRNNISNRNTINNDHVNRLYNWQQRNEQKKNSLKKKIAKAETPSFTPKAQPVAVASSETKVNIVSPIVIVVFP